MLWWKDQWLHLQQILWYMRIELHCPVYGFHCLHVRIVTHLEQTLQEVLMNVQHIHYWWNLFCQLFKHLYSLFKPAQLPRAHG